MEMKDTSIPKTRNNATLMDDNIFSNIYGVSSSSSHTKSFYGIILSRTIGLSILLFF